MRRAIGLFFLIAVAICFSCEERGLFINCADCLDTEPARTNIQIKLDMNNFSIPTAINVYEGNLEDSVLFKTLHTSSTETIVSVTLNKKYTITATYYIPDDYFVAIDAATPRVKYDDTQCDNPCYFVYDKVVDLRFKY